MEYKDYYKSLGVAKGATAKEIKAAYRKLARKHHPDMNQGNAKAEARFKEIGEAYEVLSDKEKRPRYDELGADWDSVRRSAPGPGGRPGGGVRVDFGDIAGGPSANFSEFFRTFFSGGGLAGFEGAPAADPFGAAPRPEPEVVLTLEEVLKGATRTVEVQGPGGKRRVEVRIPAGVREGSRVRIPAEAGPGPARGRGDYYLRVRLAPHESLERRGEDLQATVRVPLTTAVLGGEAEVPTLDGRIGIKIPPHTPSGQTFRLRGKGLPRIDGGVGRGDILVTLGVDLPKKLNARERELFEELRRAGV